MKLKLFGPKDWVDFTRSFILLAILLVGGVVAAGNYQWVQISDHNIADAAILDKIKVASAEQTDALMAVTRAQQQAVVDVRIQIMMAQISALDADITFLKIKISQGEATKSERIVLPTLELKMRELLKKVE